MVDGIRPVEIPSWPIAPAIAACRGMSTVEVWWTHTENESYCLIETCAVVRRIDSLDPSKFGLPLSTKLGYLGGPGSWLCPPNPLPQHDFY